VALLEAPEWTLYYFAWEKGKLLASVNALGLPANFLKSSLSNSDLALSQIPKTHKPIAGANNIVHQIAFCPLDGSLVSCVGDRYARVYRFIEVESKMKVVLELEASGYVRQLYFIRALI
jgi:hypothetical protein